MLGGKAIGKIGTLCDIFNDQDSAITRVFALPPQPVAMNQ